MKEKVFTGDQPTADFANFLNLKAKEGFTDVRVSIGSASVSIPTSELIKATYPLKGFVVNYYEGNGQLVIGDII